MGEASLLVLSIDGSMPPRRVSLEKPAITIGRSSDNDVVLADQAVSRHHLSLTRVAAGWHVARAPQGGPLFVNGVALDQAEVSDGDQVVIGGTALRLGLPLEAQVAPGQRTTMAPPPAPRLAVEWPGGRFEAPLRARELTLGRAPDCAIVVPSPLISAHHAALRQDGNGAWTITDTTSHNGLLLRGKRVPAAVLQRGEVVTIGARDSGAYVALSLAAPRGDAAATLTLIAPATGHEALIGRDPAAALSLPNPMVTWHHARLRRDYTGTILLDDLGSTNGTYVNYQRVRQTTVLQPGDRVIIGPYELTFDGVMLVPAGRAGATRLDALDLVRTAQGGRAVLLDHVTLSVLPGEFVAIVGGNGAGKTTLLKALAGIQPAQQGHVHFDGVDSYTQYDALRGQIGYVPQSDIVHGALTVERALYYAARLRLASDLRREEIEERIGEVLAQVDLSAHRQKVVEKLSGGERKRVSLAVELLAGPPILFLDEPNAPLDPGHRGELLHTIRQLAASGHTIVMVSHFLEDVQACDRVAMMGRGGRLCYFGPPAQAPAFFGAPGFAEVYAQVEQESGAAQWRQQFARSPLYQSEIVARLPTVGAAAIARPQTAARAQRGWSATRGERRMSGLVQLALLMGRYIEVLLRDRVNVAILLLQAPLIAIVLALVSDSGVFTSALGPAGAQKVLFFVAIVAIWFGTSNSVREIAKESDIYQRERLAGLGVVPYVLSKVGILALLCVVQTAILLLIVTAKTGIPPGGSSLFLPPLLEIYVGATLAGLAGLALGLAVSAFAGNPDKAISAVPLVLLPQILLAGVIFPVSGPVGAVADVMVSRWAVEALGTTADLNHLYYAQLAAANAGTTLAVGGTPGSPAGARKPAAVSSAYNPGDYDSHPSAANYTASVAPGASWADARAGRSAHLLLTWGILAGLFVGFVIVALARQRAKDPT